MLPIQNFTTVVKENRVLTSDVFELTLELRNPPEIHFRPGQYVNVRIPNEENRILFRAYSIVNSPKRSHELVLCIKCAQNGLGSYRLRDLKPGDYISLRGPIGEFFLNEHSKRDILFIAGGTGIAPFCSMIERLCDLGSTRRMKLYFGTKKLENLFYHEKYLKLQEQNRYFEFMSCLSREESKTDAFYRIGRVTHALEENLTDCSNLEAYVCGGSELIQDVKSLLLRKGMKEKDIYFEKYY